MDKLLKRVKEQAERNHFHVKFVGQNVLKDYAGMNSEAAKPFHFTNPPKGKTILIAKSWMTPKEKAQTIVHEQVEYNLMKKGVNFWQAHEAALRAEKKVKYSR